MVSPRADLERAVSLIAERVQAGAPRRATGTELAAMRLALGVLRTSAARIPRYGTRDGAALDAITCATDALAYGSYGGHPELWRMSGQARATTRDPRAVRARLALYLRARLRMERGIGGSMRRARPLWQLARGTEASDGD